MRKKKASFFVSYAHANKQSKDQFLELFREQTGAAKRFNYSFWQDADLVPGDDWDGEIKRAIEKTDFGLLLVSPAFLGSKYIVDTELPAYLANDGKRCFPVMLAPVDFNRHDLAGLESRQIFRLNDRNFKEPRAFTDLKPRRKIEFAAALFAKVDDWLQENHALDK